MLTEEARFKLDVLTTLVHESTVQSLSLWLYGAPRFAESVVEQLLRDELIFLFRVRDDEDPITARYDAREPLTTDEAVRLLASGNARESTDVMIAPTARADSLEAPAPLFAYVERGEL